jgi:hypothetical protein
MAVETRIARYPGRCAYCDDPIRVGDPIRRVTDTMDWIHASHDLAEEVEPAGEPGPGRERR